MNPKIIPLITFVSFLAAIYCLVQVIKLRNAKKPLKLSPRAKTYEWTDVFGIVRGYLGIFCWWGLWLGGR